MMVNFKQSLKLLHSALFILSLSIAAMPVAVQANPADWGMVQRFNKQQKLANDGNVKAMYDVGKLYERGRGVNRDMAKAAEWFQKAAGGGNAAAQARLGILYFEGRGVKQNYNIALKLLNDAAKENIPSAQYQLANMYELGTGVKQNLKQSIYWYKKADKYGYYLAKAKVTRLQKLLNSGGTINRKTSPQAVAKAKQAPSPIIQTLLNSRWLKRSKAVGYLPSSIANCSKQSYNTMRCISTSQERSTGSEVISYNTESVVTAKGKNKFEVVYSNNVLEVTQLEAVDGDGEVIEQAPSRIKKGKQGKSKKLSCNVKNKNTLSCSKGSSSFDLLSQQ